MEKMMMINTKPAFVVFAIFAMAMAVLLSVEGGIDVALKETKPLNHPQIFDESLDYKARDNYGYGDGDGDKNDYKDRDCDEYGTCYGNSPHCFDHDDDDGDRDRDHWAGFSKKVAPEFKEVAGKYEVHRYSP